jgi:uroporphyrinogen decarboxylase
MWLMGAKPFIRALHTDRDLVGRIFDKIGALLLEAFRQASEADGVGAVCLGDDMGLRTGTMIPHREMRKYVFPWQRKLCRAAHSKDLPFILHACGNLAGVMDDLIDYVGIDAKHSFEDAIMPVPEVKAKWGERVAILGGIDVDVLSRKDVPAVVRKVRSVMGECLPGGCWALGSGNSIPNYVKVDNYLAMLREGRKMGRYSP